MNRFLLFPILLFLVFLAKAQDQPEVTFTIETTRSEAGSTICLPVRVSNFRDIQGMQLGLQWNPDVLTFQGFQNFNLRDLDAADFNVGGSSQGNILMSWIPFREPFTLSIPDSTVIMEICFTIAADAPPGFQAVAFSNEVLTTEVYVDPDLYEQALIQTQRMRSGGVYLDEPSQLTLDQVVVDTDPDCGNSAGTIRIEPGSGTPPYSYDWTGPAGSFSAGQQAEGLVPGVYEANIMDSDGLSAKVYAIISVHGDPEPLDPFIQTVNITPTACGEANGSIQVNPDPIRTFQIRWNTGDTSEVIDNLESGEYQVTLTDILGCTQSFMYAIPTEEDIEGLTRVDDTLTCESGNALIGVLAQGNPDYDFTWNTGDTTSLISVAEAGTYELTVAASAVCTETYVFDIGAPGIDLSFTRVDGNFGCTDTSVTIGLDVDQIPDGLQVQWADGPATLLRTVTQPGAYDLTVSLGSCQQLFTFVVDDGGAGDLFYQRIDEPFSCTRQTAQIGVAVSDDLEYSFAWSETGNNGPTLEVTEPGTYSLTITSGRCEDVETFEVVPFVEPSISFAQRLDGTLSCDPNERSTIGFVERPNTNYSYAWTGGASTPAIDVDSAGRYEVVVSEGICVDTFAFLVDVNQVKNYTRQDGSLSCSYATTQIGLANNTPDYYEFNWTPGGSALPAITVDQPGTYELTIESPGRCLFQEVFTVDRETNPEGFIRLDGQLDCTGSDTVTVGLIPNPQVESPLQYSWTTGATSQTIEVTQAGTYAVTVTGSPACREQYTFAVTTLASNINYDRIDAQLNCLEPTVTIGVEDPGTDQLSYAWSNGRTSPNIAIGAAGQYQLTITDPGSGCSRVETFRQNEPAIQQAELTSTCLLEDLCGGEAEFTATVLDGEAPFVYQWNTGQVDTTSNPAILRIDQSLPISVTVTDASGCQVSLNAPAPDCIPLNELRVSVYFECTENSDDGILQAEVLTGGVPPYVYEWNTGKRDTTYFRSQVPFDPGQGMYEVTVTDALGQSGSWNFDRTEEYGCGSPASPVLEFAAPHIIVEPGDQFTYPIHVTNYEDVKGSVYTIEWDPCLVQADTIKLYGPQDTLMFTDFFGLEGIFETSAGRYGDLDLPDTIVVTEIVFTAIGAGVSPFLFSINEPASNTDMEAIPVRPVHGSITVAGEGELVTVGDANQDGAIDHYDILPIGIGFSGNGPERRRQLSSGREFAYFWPQSTVGQGSNLRHFDTDGNGQIGSSDLSVIDQNWSPGPVSYDSTGLAVFTIEADSLLPGGMDTINLHTSSVTNAYGLAFVLDYSATVLTEQDMSIVLDNSWLLVEDAGISYIRHQSDQRQVFIGLSRTDGTEVSGEGLVAQLIIQTPESLTDGLTLQITGARMTDADEQYTTLQSSTVQLPVQITTSLAGNPLDVLLSVFPNPATDWISVQATGLQINRLELFDGQGRLVVTNPNGSTLHTAQLPGGPYALRVVTNKGTVTRSIVIKK